LYDQQKAVRRRRAVLGLLVACSLILLTAYFGEGAGGSLHAIQRGFLTVVSPIQEGASRALKPVRDLFGWVGDTFDAKSQRDKLKVEVRQLRAQAVANQGATRRAAELETLLKADRALSVGQMRPVTGRVTVRNPSLWYSTIVVDRGTSDGVRLNQPVVSGDGLVGTVTTVSGNSAVVTLITDHTSGVSATDNKTGITGIVQPAVGQPNDLRLDFIRHGDKVKEGQVVVTSGTSSSRLPSLFPPGIPIGRVTQVDNAELDVYQRVHIQPFADLRRLDFVQILTEPMRGAHA
jgi:rod shape-determining protein MreC